MRHEPKVLLVDVLTALERVSRFIAGKSFDDYAADELLRAAVERQLAIIGEALWRLRSIDPQTASRVRDIDRIIAFRHVLVHGYASVDDLLVWGIVESRLSTLATDIGACLDPSDTSDL